jgi:hypothetical protein
MMPEGHNETTLWWAPPRRQALSEAMAMRSENRSVAARNAADWLCLAAAPTFAIMALLTGIGGGRADMLCSAAQHASPLSGMAPMYLLMSGFHSAPWLNLISRRRHRPFIKGGRKTA